MEALVAALGGTAWTVLFFIVGLSIIVFVHEYGHYIVGRWTGIHSEVFSVGFGPVLWSRTDRRGTRWQIAAIPFGGYVKFLGDADASSVRSTDVSGLSAAERRHTMAGAPLWARSATVFAGPLANFILSFALFAGLTLAMGVVNETPSVGKMRALPAVGESLKEGDVILALDGQKTPDWESFGLVSEGLLGKATVVYTVRRGAEEVSVSGPHPQAVIVAEVSIRSAALDAGIMIGDIVLKAGGQDIKDFDQLVQIVTSSGGKPVPLTIWRDGKTFDLSLTPRLRVAPDNKTGELTERYLLGLGSGLVFEPGLRAAGPWDAVSVAGQNMWRTAEASFEGLKKMIQGLISTCGLSGAIGMAKTIGDAARIGVETLIAVLAALSLGIGIINLFPIPVLDGGHLMFHAYEAVTRRKPSERVLGVLMTVGLTVVLSLMIFALSRDLMCA
ncbi:RIP metalloprotease RseP [Tabrizicola sp.]|uniref:RIP metalloprotease RseP n=1 Tax=Tabrizicola sp. TaxID=2005166 RepID=UPI003F2F01FB